MAYRLMIVDDSNIIRNRIERCFEGSSIEIVATANNGVDAVLKFDEFRPDFITMDLTMPQMDGLECIKRIVGKGTGVSILVVSALSDRMTALQALQVGARGFIYKPFNDEELIAGMQRLIELSAKAKK
ncbi:response regulator [Moraxella bovis]|uniref:Response regulator n=3 Tax=Moraxella TaxID=475 RepID=A0AAQ2Q477_MORBO|nr:MULTISPECIES: response regulator [Moraxella]AWY19660.1 response regulator [Moraxella bovis]OPH36972.1 response regulator [Moraxella lacunata]UYZ67979.1 response regulator [Moraxella bovis]UYZ70354.1 response regulator [Moraxella bovis]UYZ73736.1 response regulator [Moraxella bovis]